MFRHGVMKCRENVNNFLNTVLKCFAIGTLVVAGGGFIMPYIAPITSQSVVAYYLFVAFWAFLFGVIALIRVTRTYTRVVGIVATTFIFLVVYLFVYDRFYMGIIEKIERFI